MGFFDDLSSSFQESLNKTQKESKCKKTITENKKKIETAYHEMGERVFLNRGIDEGIKEYVNSKIAEIDGMLKENENLTREILTLNNKKVCPNCGKEVELNTTFCPNCGAEQEKIAVQSFIPKGKRRCSGCNEIIDDKNVFCPKCGAKKDEPVVSEAVPEVTPEEEKVEPVEQQMEQVNEPEEVKEEPIMVDEPSKEVEVDSQAEEIEARNLEDVEPINIPVVEEKNEIIEEPASEETRRCTKCGEVLAADDVFCANCGTRNEK